MTFEAFRSNGQPTFYDAVHLPWEADLVTSGLIFSFLVLAVSFFVILPGYQGKECLFTFIRVTTSLFIGAVILVANFSQTWDVAETHTTTKYKAGTGQDVNVTIGVQIGLRGVNITLKGEPDQIKGETINYNENFNWEGLQGRIGFGPFAGNFNRAYRAAQLRGLPLPILWVAEYFTLDGEGIRWGRFYRQAGWYSHIFLWMAFPCWLLANVLFSVLLRYGAYMLCCTGVSMLVSNIIWATHRNVNDLVIPFTAEEKLELTFGGSWYVTLGTGIACIIMSLTIFIMDKCAPAAVAAFFGVDVLQDSEQCIVEDDVPEETAPAPPVSNGSGGAANEAMTQEDGEDDEIYTMHIHDLVPLPKDRAAPYVLSTGASGKRNFKSTESRFTKKWQKSRRRPISEKDANEDGDDYVNASVIPMRSIPIL